MNHTLRMFFCLFATNCASICVVCLSFVAKITMEANLLAIMSMSG